MNKNTTRPRSPMQRLLSRVGLTLLTAGAIGLAAGAAMAIQPGKWEQGSEPDFQAGKRDQTVVSNLGEVTLSSRTRKLADLPIDFNAVYDVVATAGGDVYLTAGSEKSEIFKWAGGKLTSVVALKDEQAFAMTVDGRGRLLVAISAEETSRIAVLENGKLTTVVPLDGVRYIWDMAMVGDRLALVTGTPGRVLLVDLARADGKPIEKLKPVDPAAATQPSTGGEPGDGAGKDPHAEAPDPIFHPSVTQVLKARQNNLLCLAVGPNNSLYAGSDTEGLVYRVRLKKDFAAHDPMVIFDANEPEIGALLALPDGSLFVGTADASMADMNAGPGAGGGAGGLPSGPGSGHPGRNPGVQPGGESSPSTDEAAPADPAAPEARLRGNSPDIRRLGYGNPSAALARLSAGRRMDASSARMAGKMESAPPAGSAPEAATPTPMDADPIRAAIKQRLGVEKSDAAASPTETAGPGVRPSRPSSGARPVNRPMPGPEMFAPGVGPGGANGVYRITPDGFVHEVFRDNGMVLKIVREPDGKLLIGTGNSGVLYRLDPVAGEYTALADLEPEQIGSIVQLASGQTLLATSNPGQLLELDKGYANSGSFISSVFDAGQISLWGNLAVSFQAPAGTRMLVQTRSGNVQDPENGPWSAWTEPAELKPAEQPGAPTFTQIHSPPARFLQYKMTLEGNPQTTPMLQKIDATYVVPNLRPKIMAVRVTHPDDGAGAAGPQMPNPGMPKLPGMPARALRQMPPMPQPGGPGAGPMEPVANPMLAVEWEATDPNEDRMLFTLEYRALGSNVWLPVAKDLEAAPYEWQSLKVPDGRYQARLTASDSPDNPPDMALSATRVSAVFVVDNTPPTLSPLKFKQDQKIAVITGEVSDAVSTIRSIHYSVDGAAEWKMVVPDDMLFDSTKESFTIRISDLSPGEHVVSVRAVDARGNPKYASVSILVK